MFFYLHFLSRFCYLSRFYLPRFSYIFCPRLPVLPFSPYPAPIFPSCPRQCTDTLPTSEGQYARVIGTLERFNGRNTLKVKYIRRISDSHEIFRHLLEVMVLKMRLDRLTSAKVGVGVGVGNTNAVSN